MQDTAQKAPQVGGEMKTEVKTYEIDYTCPRCGIGKMRPFGPPDGIMHLHHCNNPSCAYQESFEDKRYPYAINERVSA